MNAIYYDANYSLLACILLGLLLSIVLVKWLVFLLSKSVVPSGRKSATVSILGRVFLLVEISAEHRLDYLKRCMTLDATDSFQFMRDNLTVSSELIALHMQRWYLPRRYTAFCIRQLTDAAIAELFRECVAISGLPFSIVKNDEADSQLQRSDLSVESEHNSDDEWDWVDDEDEKKNRPAVRQ